VYLESVAVPLEGADVGLVQRQGIGWNCAAVESCSQFWVCDELECGFFFCV
jgi:hypothetical protein